MKILFLIFFFTSFIVPIAHSQSKEDKKFLFYSKTQDLQSEGIKKILTHLCKKNGFDFLGQIGFIEGSEETAYDSSNVKKKCYFICSHNNPIQSLFQSFSMFDSINPFSFSKGQCPVNPTKTNDILITDDFLADVTSFEEYSDKISDDEKEKQTIKDILRTENFHFLSEDAPVTLILSQYSDDRDDSDADKKRSDLINDIIKNLSILSNTQEQDSKEVDENFKSLVTQILFTQTQTFDDVLVRKFQSLLLTQYKIPSESIATKVGDISLVFKVINRKLFVKKKYIMNITWVHRGNAIELPQHQWERIFTFDLDSGNLVKALYRIIPIY
jgi:hypothetical protein